MAIGILGVVMAHYPMIFSRFQRIQGGLADTRLIHYLLEHGYRWVRREPTHLEFWNPPFFFPIKNVAAYSDVLLTVGPIYWLARAPASVAGLRIRIVDPVHVDAQLRRRVAALPQRTRFRYPGRGGRRIAGRLRFAATEPDGAPATLALLFPLLTLYALARLFGNMSLGRQRGWPTGCWR